MFVYICFNEILLDTFIFGSAKCEGYLHC